MIDYDVIIVTLCAALAIVEWRQKIIDEQTYLASLPSLLIRVTENQTSTRQKLVCWVQRLLGGCGLP